MSTAPVFSEVQKINPSAIIELFTLQLNNSLHGATTIYRFHSGSNLNANGEIVWAGNSYQRFPIEATRVCISTWSNSKTKTCCE